MASLARRSSADSGSGVGRSADLRAAHETKTLLIDSAHEDDVRDVAFSKFVFEAVEVQEYMRKYSLTTKELLKSMVRPVSRLARPPISEFCVGAVGVAASGRVYVGVNVEFASLPLGNSIHAEQFLVANLRHHGERDLAMVAVNAAPCGHCRQFFSELACSDAVQFVFGDGAVDQFSLDELLPHRFRPEDLLGNDPPPLLLRPQDNPVALTPEALDAVRRRDADPVFGKAVEAALLEAQQSYAPYSQCPAGVALITAGGEVYSGGYIESAAYNPSLPPLQTAIVDAVIDHIPCFSQVREVVLVERADAVVRHELSIRCMMPQIAPDAVLTVLPVAWSGPNGRV